jgi:hypothetical protein
MLNSELERIGKEDFMACSMMLSPTRMWHDKGKITKSSIIIIACA